MNRSALLRPDQPASSSRTLGSEARLPTWPWPQPRSASFVFLLHVSVFHRCCLLSSLFSLSVLDSLSPEGKRLRRLIRRSRSDIRRADVVLIFKGKKFYQFQSAKYWVILTELFEGVLKVAFSLISNICLGGSWGEPTISSCVTVCINNFYFHIWNWPMFLLETDWKCF